MGKVVRRFDVFLVNLDPTVRSEIRKTGPCLVVSPDEMHRFVRGGVHRLFSLWR